MSIVDLSATNQGHVKIGDMVAAARIRPPKYPAPRPRQIHVERQVARFRWTGHSLVAR